MTRRVDVDYLVVGAGATGMAFADALIDHANVRVALVDRRHSVGGHWLSAYPFVRLHQASAFYGVASTLLGGGLLQQRGPEAGLSERASAAEVCAYYERIADRLLGSGKAELFMGCEYVGDRRFVSRVSGRDFEVPAACRIVDAAYLAPSIPATTPPPFGVGEGAHVIPVNDLVRVAGAAPRYVIVGSGKTATDACVWLLAQGVDAGKIRWVRPREPWMLNRAVIQPDPVVFFGMVADMMKAATSAESMPDLFLRLEDAGIMMRVDPAVAATMARAPTLAAWELAELRKIEDVVRLGHIREVTAASIMFDDRSVALERGALVVHCAAAGLKQPPSVPIWRPSAITLQPIRAGFPCFGAALAGYVEATRRDDAEKNLLCPPTPYGNSLTDWVRMTVLGARSVRAFSSQPDIKDWSDRVALNPARTPTETSAALDDVLARLAKHGARGLARLGELASV